jgi:asparagine synthase (glutamine-hydrolysing)
LSYCASTPQDDVNRVLSSDFLAALDGQTFDQVCQAHMSQRGLKGLARMQERDLSIYLPNHNLLYTDKMGMAVGLEARVPFLDLDLVQAALRYPSAWKLNSGVTKVLLRMAAQGVVPDRIISRPKAGFGAPYRKWLRHDLAEMWNDTMNEAAVKQRGWFDFAKLENARLRSQLGFADLYMLQWAALTMELWACRFID